MSKYKNPDSNVFQWKSIDPRGGLLSPAYPGDAGYDMIATQFTPIEPGEIAKIPCGIQIAVPKGTCAIVFPRSSTVSKGVHVFSTIIDDYRGDIFVFAINLSKDTVSFLEGDRPAQLVLVPIPEAELRQVDELRESTRGTNGFGSSGGVS